MGTNFRRRIILFEINVTPLVPTIMKPHCCSLKSNLNLLTSFSQLECKEIVFDFLLVSFYFRCPKSKILTYKTFYIHTHQYYIYIYR